MILHTTLSTALSTARRHIPVALALATLATVATTPAVAAASHHHTARSLNGLYMYGGEALDQHDPVQGAMPMNEGRATAMHDCNMKAAPYSFSTWETTQFAVYGTCMAEHGQQQ
jgi:hypothetical protein